MDGYVVDKIKEWEEEIDMLSKIAEMYPHAAYTAFTRAIMGKWKYLMRTIDGIGNMLQPLEKAISAKFIPALTGRGPCSSVERAIISLPIRYGGLNLVNPVNVAHIHYKASLKITEPLKKMIISQATTYKKLYLHGIKADLQKHKNQYQQQLVVEIRESLSPTNQRTMDLLQLKGSSSWLSALPLKDQGFNLSKGEFRHALSVRYGWQLKNLPQYCICGTSFSADHAMICPHGGMIISRHNKIRDLTADWMSEVCKRRKLNRYCSRYLERLSFPVPRISKKMPGSILRLSDFGDGSKAHFLMLGFSTPSYRDKSVAALFRKHELDKKREYGHRIREVENGSFTPLVFSTTGGASRETTVVFKRLAELLADKRNLPYSITLAWMRCHVSFALMKSTISCIRGSRVCRRRHTDMGIATVVAEGNLLVDS